MRLPMCVLGLLLVIAVGAIPDTWAQESGKTTVAGSPQSEGAVQAERGQPEATLPEAQPPAVEQPQTAGSSDATEGVPEVATIDDSAAGSEAAGSPQAVTDQNADATQAPGETEGVNDEDQGDGASETSSTDREIDFVPVILVVIGIVSVLGMIIGFKLNAFLALIISALIVSLGVGFVQDQDAGSRMSAVVSGFGKSAGGIGIVIAMAAIIGKCMLDSGAADRIVRQAVKVTGEKKASFGLMISGFVLAIPVFFDTVFYLLVPLARSLYRRTNQHYLKYLMAIATGGAITHTLVPPTPGPLLVSAILGVDIGVMMLIGTLVAVPAAAVGLLYSVIADKLMPVEMRPLGSQEEKHESLSEDQLPSLAVSLLPVLIPVVLIGLGTVATTIADSEDQARFTVSDVTDYERLASEFANAEADSPAARVIGSSRLTAEEQQTLTSNPEGDEQKQQYVDALNLVLLDEDLYDEDAFLGVRLSPLSKKKLGEDQVRMKPVDRRRMNRSLLEDAYPDLIEPHQWNTSSRTIANRLALPSNANFALILAAIVAMLTLKAVRSMSWRRLGEDVEESLMSGGVIILITAAGGAFGAMLTDTNINDTIKEYFSGSSGSGLTLLLLAWGIAAVLKIAQGSSTVAMIVGAGMMAAIIGEDKPEFHMVYIATAVGTGSLFGSWMNDSGFWVFTKMGGLTEAESLRSWTPLLVVLSIVGLLITILLSGVMPMKASL